MQKLYRLVAIVMLIMIFNPAHCAVDDFDPEEKRTPAQIYYDQVQEDSEFKMCHTH